MGGPGLFPGLSKEACLRGSARLASNVSPRMRGYDPPVIDAPDPGAKHESAAATHDRAAARHEQAAVYWASRGDFRRADLERRNAAIERDAAQLERDRAQLERECPLET
jgi:hypothetical protein